MTAFDVIIVGSGPAGSTCAATLRKHHFNVKLLDKKVFPRIKPCAGWVTPQVIQALQIDVEDYQRSNTIQPITGFRTGMIDGRVIETNYDYPVSFGIRRIEFDNYLLLRSGVQCESQSVRKIEREDGSWLINAKYSAPLIVGAGGHFCPVARAVNNTARKTAASPSQNGDWSRTVAPTVYAQEVEFEMSGRQASDDHIDAEKPELYFCQDLQGYGWCFRKGNFLNVGLGRLEKKDLSAHVRAFWDFLRTRKKLVDPCPSHFLGHAYRVYADRSPHLYDDGVLLIGDAAGLAYPHSGEGIRPAVESAMIAADVIRNVHGDYSSRSLALYEQQLIKRLGKTKPSQVAQWLPVAWLHNIAARLLATRWFARHIVIENWFLHSRQDSYQIDSAG